MTGAPMLGWNGHLQDNWAIQHQKQLYQAMWNMHIH